MSLESSPESISQKPAETLYAFRTYCLKEFADRYGGKIVNPEGNPFWLADQIGKLGGQKFYSNIELAEIFLGV